MRTLNDGTEELSLLQKKAVSEEAIYRNEQRQLNLENRKSLGDSILDVIVERKPDTSALIFLHCALFIVKEAEKNQF